MIFLGIDTSNYTTSVCAIDNGKIISKRKILDVKTGERGLRQSDGVFQHMKNLPLLYKSLCEEINPSRICAVGVSTRPRSVEGSYMPVFLAGDGYARVISDTLGVPLYEFSHQDGHIMSGIRSCEGYDLLEKEFISVHLSGGTTEILKSSYNGSGFECEIVGGSLDISAGQFIDRVGVALGMEFPAGIHMDKLANETEASISLPIKTRGAWMNLSGVETKAIRMIGSADKAELARGVLLAIKSALSKTITAALKENNLNGVLVAGGVASNSIIREELRSLNADVRFASREFSTDNAMGIAELARLKYGNQNRNGIANQCIR